MTRKLPCPENGTQRRPPWPAEWHVPGRRRGSSSSTATPVQTPRPTTAEPTNPATDRSDLPQRPSTATAAWSRAPAQPSSCGSRRWKRDRRADNWLSGRPGDRGAAGLLPRAVALSADRLPEWSARRSRLHLTGFAHARARRPRAPTGRRPPAANPIPPPATSPTWWTSAPPCSPRSAGPSCRPGPPRPPCRAGRRP